MKDDAYRYDMTHVILSAIRKYTVYESDSWSMNEYMYVQFF